MLFLNAQFYSKHPVFTSFYLKHNNYFSSPETLLKISVSSTSFDTGCSGEDLVKAEALHCCSDKTWSSLFMNVRLVNCCKCTNSNFYPDFGFEKYKLFFNQTAHPRFFASCSDTFYILFCCSGTVINNDDFQPNHFVPLIPFRKPAKRKLSSIDEIREKRINLSSPPKKRTKILLSSFVHTIDTKLKHDSSILDFFFKTSFKNCDSDSKPSSSLDYSTSEQICSSNEPKQTIKSYFGTSHNKTLFLPKNIETDKELCIYDKNDIATFSNQIKSLSTEQILNLAKNVFIPDSSYIFPKRNCRSFRIEWLKSFSWLAYSPSLDGAFCLPCILFGNHFPSKNHKLKKLYSEPFCDWRHASSTFLLHEGVHKIQAGKKFTGLHFDTQSTYTKLLSDSSGVTDPINLILNTNLKNKIAENREKLTPIVDTIKLCGHLGLSLRGHRDGTKFHAEIGEYSSGQVGNFIELLNFRVRAGDKVLEKHLQNSSKNAKYISKEI